MVAVGGFPSYWNFKIVNIGEVRSRVKENKDYLKKKRFY